ncbi:unnamed protein product [Acanthoscelides obtectus]|uniref:Uncharacterized protein n=1 Tax=Acanthoscelides obtectus TaxID=200917 RepID=A0A9P0KBK0_ACAOB|nr:unnamed protein product [Acanthoscelides obtectus]CAK1649305.1 hypothetical protein AOBTE_LOCUS16142 [Acanthoscelides obtectus]
MDFEKLIDQAEIVFDNTDNNVDSRENLEEPRSPKSDFIELQNSTISHAFEPAVAENLNDGSPTTSMPENLDTNQHEIVPFSVQNVIHDISLDAINNHSVIGSSSVFADQNGVLEETRVQRDIISAEDAPIHINQISMCHSNRSSSTVEDVGTNPPIIINEEPNNNFSSQSGSKRKRNKELRMKGMVYTGFRRP